MTAKALNEMGVPFCIIVEEQERDEYARVIRGGEVLTLDPQFQRDYDTFDDLGDSRSKGPGPARNFAWQHAVDGGHEFHWVMDDNINGFYRFNRNLKVRCTSGAPLRAMEDFVVRYKNVLMAGPTYFMFVTRKSGRILPFTLNTRVYSCNLIRCDAPYRWRGRYNEDTDLSLRMLKDGWCTILFNAFLQYKMPTQSMKGGNTSEFYDVEGVKKKGSNYAEGGTLEKSKMQVRMHPDVSKLVRRFGRWHHYVDYSRFKRNRLIRQRGVVVQKGTDNYGMRLIHVEPGRITR